ncbi:hypothetical protein TRIATDRAFT_280478 [Trichoderma atroviride IMI 206040]|uniref:Uncharacterized protein n=1 Tax=Hypocrea atroviridis (strain ATCC 20476 / IMI 206040) TaxID=452589 RepID=G9NH72_HYPAI|nr:uncharacterized protein TRIATDRAFT_280478 [Trichoderma atroviride IMI 206040]EHK49967.1 hypothetical protein TRIATDRAFT_280478 [Trichoderma atroviride IMI 206040]
MARGRSVPARASPKESPPRSDNGYDNSKSITAAIIPSPSISPIPSNGSIITARPNSKLLRNADALARMTIELNVRAMATQTARLEKNLSVLMLRTKEDKEFRNTHDARVQSLVQEIQAVKQRMEEIQGPEWNSKSNNDLEQCKKDMHEIIGELKKEMKEEMSDLKGRVGNISSTLGKLPTVAEAEALISHTRVTRSALKRKMQAKPDAEKSRSVPKEAYRCVTKAAKTIKQRIEDAISSTRRWNRDHKSTKLIDAAFIANYLKQQSKRDPQMAVYIQKAIQRHVYHSGRPRSKTRPRNLEQFCQTLVWEDVLDTVKDVLVDNRVQTAKALARELIALF